MRNASTMLCVISTTVITILSLCPGYLSGQRFTRYDRQDNMYVNNSTMSVIVASELECCIVCGTNDSCRSVSYNEDSYKCQLNDIHHRDVQLSFDNGWTSLFKYIEPVWTSFQNRSYLFVNLKKSWPDSQAHCQSLGGHLAVPRSLEHVNHFVDITTCMPGWDTCFPPWIGISDVASEGAVVGVNGNMIPQEVLNKVWDNYDDLDCGYVDIGWYDAIFMWECNDLVRFICERFP